MSDQEHMRKDKWPETRGELHFQNKTWNSQNKKPRWDKTSPLCDRNPLLGPTPGGPGWSGWFLWKSLKGCTLFIFSAKLATISNVWCLEICPGMLFLLLLKSIICGFLMAIYTCIHLLQCIVVVRSFLRMLNLRKLAVSKPYLSRGGHARCQGVSDYGLNLHWNIPLMRLGSTTWHDGTHCLSSGP